ncbi:hypothetical protein TNCV_42391 [Trichonephila clavipes]|nr:hypothetical protein TNCV_42391 [Trichonephila clavipes]
MVLVVFQALPSRILLVRCQKNCSPPHAHTLCNHRIPLDNKCRIESVVWLPSPPYTLVISNENVGFSAEDHTVPVGQYSAKVQLTLPMMWGSSKRLNGRRLLIPVWASRFRKVFLDTTGCLEDGSRMQV